MPEPPFDVGTANRWFAVEFNNGCWDLLEASDRSDADNERMLHMAHAACLHWLQAGTTINHLRALALLADAHAAVGDGPIALRYATHCRKLAEDRPDGLSDFDVATSFASLARAHAACGNRDDALRNQQLAREAGEQISDAEDKKVFEDLFAAGNWHGLQPTL